MAFDDLELPSGNARDVVGGSATYSSFAASSFTDVRIVAVVGDDFPTQTLTEMHARGIDTGGVERASGRTFRWAGRYDEDLIHRTTLDTQLNVFATFKPKIPAAYRDTPMVLLGNIHPGLQIDVLDQVSKPRVVVADTMNFWISGERQLLGDLLKRIDILVINDEEARQLSGYVNIRRAARAIHQLGPKRLIIKRGEHGALLFDEHGPFFVPAYPLEDVLDPTGAGDAFAGGLMGYLARHGDPTSSSLRRAMFYASAIASFCVEGIGTNRLAKATREELASRIYAFGKMVDYGGSLAIAD
jgi:sugar/nucleoside kinase (ribokinase family)